MTDKKIQEARKMLCSYLLQVATSHNLTHDMIAERTGFQRSNVSRMLSGKYSPSLDNFIKLCDAIVVYVFIVDKDAPDSDTAKLMRDRWKRKDDSN